MEEDNKKQKNVEAQNVDIQKEVSSSVNTETSESKFTPMGQINEKVPKKKKGKAGLILIILLLLAIVIGVVYYYFAVYTNAKAMYQNIIKAGIGSITKSFDMPNTIKSKVGLDVDLDINEGYIDKADQEVIDLINNIDASLELNIDVENKNVFLGLNSNYENEELLNAQMLIDAKQKGTFVKLEQFFDNIIKLDVDEDYYNSLYDSLDFEKMTLGQKINNAKVTKIIQNEFQAIIKDKYCSKEREKITINSKEIMADKYVLKMGIAEFKYEIETVLENLLDNEDYLNCFKDKEEQRQRLEDTLEKLNDLQIQDGTLYIKIYRTGIMQKIARVDFEVEAEGESLVLKIEKANDSYKFYIILNEEQLLSGTVKLEDLDNDAKKIALSFDLEELGTITFNIEASYKVNEPINNNMNTNYAVEAKNIKTEDLSKATQRLLESKLYELIEKFSEISKDNDIELPSENHTGTSSSIEKNITARGEKALNSTFVVFAKNDNRFAVDMEIEVEFYDAQGKFLGSSSDDLMAVGAGKDIAIEMLNAPANFATYEIYVDAEETEETQYFDEISMTHNNTGEGIVVQVKNNSDEMIEFITVSVVYYNQGKVVGLADAIDSDVKAGRSGNFNLNYPYDSNYENVQFDDYKVFVNEAYSYNW